MFYLRACASEFIGTFMLVFTLGCNTMSGQVVWGGISTGCVLMALTYALAPISGAHFNPAVTFSLGVLRRLEGGWFTVALYCAAQLAAGVAASLCCSALFLGWVELSPAPGHGWASACACEALYTCMLCFVVLNVAASEANADRQFYGVAIGLAVIAGTYGAGAISGACLNPALAIAIDLGGLRCDWCIPYTLAELAGAAAATCLFAALRPEELEGAVAEDEDLPEPGIKAKFLSELVGTYFLVLTVGLNVLTDSPAAALSIAASLACMIFALGDLSEAHFNPAVTMAVYAIQKIDVRTGLIYGIAQFSGAAVAGLTYVAICGNDFALGAAAGWSWTGVAAAETAFTFLLCFVMLSVTMSSKHRLSELYGLAIALCVVAGGFAAGGVSGGSLNPAVSFGVAVGDRGASAGQALLYAGFEFLSSVFAASAFMVTQGEFC
ncbi:unnamed protein product [Prorocentrum cordatum]|uniref:Aquaporin n=1 Tax=Prorocentrum cordatum TaxID=2364126 RepID=A0ABN9SNJ8_9DINO|nr:unnamed protein product [Polarella glacialis]|mmetsp:Transcript_72645/g.196453  ORF Transcript_72645/g.196453 Transcript_72645/m.196453 type:complete len:438 (-) Transcript_72645:87-1400(-)